MIRLVYVSTCSHNVKLTDIESLLKSAEQRNRQTEISGMLCWSGEYFLQCFEGDRAAVTKCFSQILVDSRHHSVELILSAPTSVRWFSQWGMGFSRTMTSGLMDLPDSSGKGFNPYLLQATDLEATFERLATLAQRMESPCDDKPAGCALG